MSLAGTGQPLNREHAREHLDFLYGAYQRPVKFFLSTGGWDHRTQKYGSSWRDTAFTYPNDVEAALNYADQESRSGKAVFLTCRTFTGARGRKAQNAEPNGLVVWCELDTKNGSVENVVQQAQTEGAYVVWSGSGGAHVYYRLTEALSSGELEKLNISLRERWNLPNGVDSVHDMSRVLRLAGSWHDKTEAKRPVYPALGNTPHPVEKAALLPQVKLRMFDDTTHSADFYRWTADNAYRKGLTLDEAVRLATSTNAPGTAHFDGDQTRLRADVERIYAKLDTKPGYARPNFQEDLTVREVQEPKEPRRFAFTSGATFALDVPKDVPPVWGSGTKVMWAVGEALMVCGPSGVGKTTIAGQLAAARLGLANEVLGMPVVAGKKNSLYLACDRPYQARRSMNRLMQPEWRDVLAERLVVWEGPPPEDFAKNTDLLTQMCEAADADTVFVDSLKDVVIGIKEDEPGAAYNRARQTALRAGIQVIELHHQVKRGANGNEPSTISDVYGSVWITAGAGSVMLLWGDPGDPIVKMKHLKQPAEEIGPFDIVHDHYAGNSTVSGEISLAVLAKQRDGLTAKEAAQAMFDTTKPTTAEVEKARRRLEKLVREGVLVCLPGAVGGAASTYQILTVKR